MKIELKNLKIAAHLSEETTAYSATIHVDGKRAFDARNDGHGGADHYHPLLGYTGPSEQEINALLADNVAPAGPFQADPAERAVWDNGSCCDLEMLVARLMATHEAEKVLKRLLSRQIVTLSSDGKLYQYKAAPTPERLDLIRQRKPDETIVNGADAAIQAQAVRALANEPDHAEAVYARLRQGDVTRADAQWLLAQDRKAERPDPDLQTRLTQIIATADARIAEYREARSTAKAS